MNSWKNDNKLAYFKESEDSRFLSIDDVMELLKRDVHPIGSDYADKPVMVVAASTRLEDVAHSGQGASELDDSEDLEAFDGFVVVTYPKDSRSYVLPYDGAGVLCPKAPYQAYLDFFGLS